MARCNGKIWHNGMMETLVFCIISVLVMPKWGCDKMIVFISTFGHHSDALFMYIHGPMNLELLNVVFA